ncbi:MAG: type III-B CRISPR module RAMP protein Cmr4 [Thermoguttaceae bacterium]|jgi:CRISPR-associated protein Cmr4
MPSAAAGFFLYVETSLHIGAGEPGRVIDLPLNRDEDGVPLVPESSLRGSLVAAIRPRCDKDQIVWAFGSPPGSEKPQVGVLSFSPMRPLLFPVRTYQGVFAWVTCTSAIAAWLAEAEKHGVAVNPPPIAPPGEFEAIVAPDCPMLTGRRTLIIEEFSFPVRQADGMRRFAEWLAGIALPREPAYGFWRERFSNGVVLVPDEVFAFFLQHQTAVTQRVAIDPATGTAQDGAMWIEESMPSETLLYGFVSAEDRGHLPPVTVSGVSWLKQLEITRLQIGANRTLGGGLVRWVWI